MVLTQFGLFQNEFWLNHWTVDKVKLGIEIAMGLIMGQCFECWKKGALDDSGLQADQKSALLLLLCLGFTVYFIHNFVPLH